MFRVSGIFAPLARFPENFNSPPRISQCEQVCLSFRPIRFVPQTGFHIQHRPTKYFSNLSKVLHIFSALLCFSEYFKVNIVHWLSNFPLSYLFWKFCVGFEVNFTFEFVIYIEMVERVSSLLNPNIRELKL